MTGKRRLDFVLYICIALAFGLLCIVFAEYDIDSKWLSLLFETSLVFGVVIAEKRQFWRVSTFWAVFLIGFVIRGFISILVVQHVPRLRAAWVGTAFLVETVAYIGLLDAVLPRFSTPKPVRKHR
jgi:hypothetical protein